MRAFTKRRIVWLAVLSACVVAVVFAFRINHEPVVQGRPLGEWLAVASDGSPANAVARTNAENAIRELGPEAIPFLLRQLETPPGWRERWGRTWNKVVSYRFWVDVHRASDIREQAVTGFEILGTNGASALPKLRELIRDDRYVVEALSAIKCIKSDEALDALIPLLSHCDPRVRLQTVYAIKSFGDRDRMARAASELERLTDDPDEDTAVAATYFVGDLLPVDRAIPLLTGKFNDPRPRVARFALGGFFAAGPHAEPAMPKIATMLTNSDEKTRGTATNVLLTINPFRAPEFGVNTNGLEDRYYRIHRSIRQAFATNNVPYLRQ